MVVCKGTSSPAPTIEQSVSNHQLGSQMRDASCAYRLVLVVAREVRVPDHLNIDRREPREDIRCRRRHVLDDEIEILVVSTEGLDDVVGLLQLRSVVEGVRHLEHERHRGEDIHGEHEIHGEARI